MTLRVLHCIYDDPGNPWVAGGGAVRVRELYRRLQGDVEVTVASGNFPGARNETIQGVRYVRLGTPISYALSRWTYARRASHMLRTAPYDVAVFDFSVYTPLSLPRKRPLVLTVHHVTGPTARARWGHVIGSAVAGAERRTIRQARWITATSLATLEALRPLARKDAEITLVTAGVPDELFELCRREEDFLLFFGRMDWFQKGLDTLLEAFRLLVEMHPGIRLVLAGRGKDAERVERRSRELGIAHNVQLVGSVSDEERRRLFATARVLLMPSRFEGFGMVAAEAMAAGVPVVAAAAGSLPEVVDAPHGGVLVPPGDAAAFADAVNKLLHDSGRRASLSFSARRSAQRFRWDAVAREHYAVLRRAAEQQNHQPDPHGRTRT
ncbi:MAG: glycosyltransferase family 4 protein [Gemmatimonadetes bacterium]|nr:glycosyltransferase family 4 protein [Gemmatimonadota bacterium]